MELTTDLHHRAQRAYAHLVVDDVDATEAVMLACDLLVAGVDNESTLTLAIQSTRSLMRIDAEDMLRDMLIELGIPEPDPQRAARLATTDLCARILDGTLSPEAGGHRLLGTLAQMDDANAIDRLLRLLGRAQCCCRWEKPDPEVRRDLRTFAGDLIASLSKATDVDDASRA